jgi:hypothetical protein
LSLLAVAVAVIDKVVVVVLADCVQLEQILVVADH